MKSWLRKFADACATISLLAGVAAAQTAVERKPAIALLEPNDQVQWRKWTQENGWRVIVPTLPPSPSLDTRVRAVADAVAAAVKEGSVDAAHVYIAGRSEASAAVFYAISRIPDAWAAGVALSGSPKSAIDTALVFSANFTNTPVLWVGGAAGDEALAARLNAAGLKVEWRSPQGLANSVVFEWLAAHARAEFPNSVDCETNSPNFAGCYWVQAAKFDPGERNDVLPTSRINMGSGAALDVGGFGFKLDDPGPGVLITFLPDHYNGPLKMGDRIVELEGKAVANPREFMDFMNRIMEERPMVALVQRGKDRTRLETRVVVPPRDAAITARVQGQFDSEEKTIQIVSRTVVEMRVTIPQAWLPADLFWNGLSLENIEKPGCYLLTIEKELLNAAPCPQ